MRRLTGPGILFAVLAMAGCSGGGSPDAGMAPDAGLGTEDAGSVDAGPVDSGTEDAGLVDAGLVDSGPVDAGPVDSGPIDSGPVDSGIVDSGPGTIDSGPADAGPVDAGPIDAGPVDSGPVDAGPVDSGPVVGLNDAGAANSVTGSLGFSVVTSVSLPPFAACGTCGTLEDGGLSATALFLSDQDVTTLACELGDAGFADNTHVIVLQLAAANYVSCTAPGADPGVLEPGTYAILDEHVSDEDICGNVPAADTGALAILQYLYCAAGSEGNCVTEGWAESGTVTVTSVSADQVTGTFDVEVGTELEDGGTPDGGSATMEVKGSFDTSACPITDGGTTTSPPDAGPVDAGPVDSGPTTVEDAGMEDAGMMMDIDSGPVDAGPVDAGTSPAADAGTPDAGTVTTTPCLQSCVNANPTAFATLEGYLLTDCACASGSPCASTCSNECPAVSTPSTACAQCLLNELESISPVFSCAESAVSSCGGTCESLGECAGECEL